MRASPIPFLAFSMSLRTFHLFFSCARVSPGRLPFIPVFLRCQRRARIAPTSGTAVVSWKAPFKSARSCSRIDRADRSIASSTLPGPTCAGAAALPQATSTAATAAQRLGRGDILPIRHYPGLQLNFQRADATGRRDPAILSPF